MQVIAAVAETDRRRDHATVGTKPDSSLDSPRAHAEPSFSQLHVKTRSKVYQPTEAGGRRRGERTVWIGSGCLRFACTGRKID